MQGKVKWFNNAKGYGFIQGDDNVDVFAHYSQVVDGGFKTLTEGEKVEYEVQEGPKGPRAVSIKRAQ